MKIKLFTLIGLITILFSCEKNTNEFTQSKLTIEGFKAKQIYKQEVGKNTTDNQFGLVPFANESEIDWNNTFKDASTNLLITPIKTKVYQKTKFYTQRFLVTDLSNNIGKYYTVINEKEILKEKVATLVNNNENISQETKAIFCYGINNKPIDNQMSSRGGEIHALNTKSSVKTPLVLGKDEELPEGIAPPPEGGGGGTSTCVVYTIDWYWQTWVNGILVNETYMYSTSQTYCTAGGSGGGGSNGGGVNCNTVSQSFLAMGAATSGTTTYVDVPLNSDLTRYQRTYNWSIFTAGTWGLLSYEKATLVKVTYPNMSRYEFESFTHTSITHVGTSIGGTRTYNDLGASINITGTGMRADVQVDFTVTSTPVHSACPGMPSVTIPYNATKFFIAPNTITVVPGQ